MADADAADRADVGTAGLPLPELQDPCRRRRLDVPVLRRRAADGALSGPDAPPRTVALVSAPTEALSAWCVEHLGCAVDRVRFRTGYFSDVVGVRLADGRDVVVKVRPASPRIGACAAVHELLHRRGFPCATPLLGPMPYPGGRVATVEAHVAPLAGEGSSAASAALLARLVALAPPADSTGGRLDPPPAWVRWDHDERGVWPQPDDGEVDLNAVPVGWIDALGSQARRLLLSAPGRRAVGHADWTPDNVWWTSAGAPHAVHDWDSVAVLPEAALAGVAAAIHRNAATVAESTAFLTAYEGARTRWTAGDRRVFWAAGLWVRLFDTKKDLLAGRAVRLTASEAQQRSALALAT